MFDAIEFVHGLRKHVDACIVEVDFLTAKIKDGTVEGAGREVALAKTKLQEAKMWLGKVLEEMGSELPAEFQDKSDEQNQDELSTSDVENNKQIACDCGAAEGEEHAVDCALIGEQSSEEDEG